MSVPPVSRTARDRVRDEVTREILAVARTHLAHEGAAALSLRSVARDLGLAPSALYRYFNGRDALLSALIVEAYSSLADAAEAAAEEGAEEGAAEEAQAGAVNDAARWMAVPCAMRTWALARPHEWGLIFGSPVPGYQAPEETIAPYTRLAAALAHPVAEAYRSGRLNTVAAEPGSSGALDAALAPVRDGLMPDVPTSIVLRLLQAWSTIVGAISLELFGHWRNAVLDPELFFTRSIELLSDEIGLCT
jgi:AcrR family transcriptional regulator